MKTLHSVNDVAHIVGLNGMAKLQHRSFQVRKGQLLLDSDAGRQSLQGASHLICVNDGRVGQPEHASAATMPFGHKTFGDQYI